MTQHVLGNATIWPGDGRCFDGYVVIDDNRIHTVAIGHYRGPLPVENLNGLTLTPGLIDSMVVGAFGHRVLDGDLLYVARRYLSHGVTCLQLCGANMTWGDFERATTNVSRAMNHSSPDTAEVIGIYHEGPFILPDACGGNRPELCQPATTANIEKLLYLCGETLTMLNVSPGIEDDTDAVRRIVARGLTVTMCHSNVPANRVLACLDAGTSILGHAWNNNMGLNGDTGLPMPTLEHVALLDKRVRYIHLIADGHHVDPLWIALTVKCRGLNSICLVTDALPCAGMPDGCYTFDDGQLYHKANGVGRDGSGRLFGGAMLLDEQFRNFVRMTGAAPHEAIRCVTLNPAKSLGVDDRMGLIEPGRVADLLAWDEALRLIRIWRFGRELIYNGKSNAIPES